MSADAGPANEEILVPFPDSLRFAPTATECRSTLLITSLTAVQHRGRLKEYESCIDKGSLTAIQSAVAGTWLPLPVAHAHYTACNALGFTTQEQLELGGEVVGKLQQTFLGTVLKAARSSGAVSAWVGLTKFNQIYARTFQGGGARITKLGPKDVRFDVVGLPLAAVPYFRVAYRGFIRSGAQFFAARAFCSDIPKSCTATTLAYRLSWA